MRAMLSAVGTRGDVQPIFAVAAVLRELGHQVRLCIPPNFVATAKELGFDDAVAVGVEMRAPRKDAPNLTAEDLAKLRASMPDLVGDQFDKIEPAVDGCDVILGANAHQYAARSLAELKKIPYVTALYAPIAIPSTEHAPPPNPGEAWTAGGDAASNTKKWEANLASWNARALERVNHHRAKRGLAAIDDVLRFNITDSPWLAVDAALAPVPSDAIATGAWILDDKSSLSSELDAFLAAGSPPIYFGFGSMPAPQGVSRVLIEAARAAGRRAIVSRGWAELGVVEAKDVITIGDVNQQGLFPRCAVVVHHGGAGTTATAARAGVAQVIAPMFSDQFYWASRVVACGIGAESKLTIESLTSAFRSALSDDTVSRARRFAATLSNDGAKVAAHRLVDRA